MITDIETESLETHVALCQQRYASLERRLTSLEDKVDRLYKLIEDTKTAIIKAALGIGVSALIALFSAVYVVKFH